MTIQEVAYGSAYYDAALDIRDRVLRQPLGLQFSEEDLEKERHEYHLVAIENDVVLGTILMRVISSDVIKMRQVAIDFDYQKGGIGTDLVAFSEEFSRKGGWKQIELHARDVAIPFYERLGYHVVGEEFFEVGISHHKMVKSLYGDQ